MNALNLSYDNYHVIRVKAKTIRTRNIFFLIVAFIIITGFTTLINAQGFTNTTFLSSISVSANTGEKPQSKIWTHSGSWFAVLPTSSGTPGTHIWRLDGTTWSNILLISNDTNTYADCKVVGNVTHIFLYSGTSSELVSVEYLSGSNSYQLWTTRPANVTVTLTSGVETASIDIDANGRMWLASDGGSSVNVRWSDSPYSTWSSAISLASFAADDICAIAAFDDDDSGSKIGVLWSNQNTDRYGFKYHVDGDPPSNWSPDEVPADNAPSFGNGVADDHLNLAVASDGTIFAAVKTSYDAGGYPKIALLRRDRDGTWDDLYEVDGSGTRGIAVLNESLGKIRVIYTASEGNNDIVYKESSTSTISFGTRITLINGSNNNVTSTKQNYTDDIVIMASNGSTTASVLASDVIDLAAHWKMDEGSGTSIIDASPNGNNGSLSGSPSWDPGVFDQALLLDGSSDYATVPDDATLDLTDGITLAVWIKPEKPGTQYIIKKAIINITNGYELSLSNPGYVFVRFNQATSGNSYRIDSDTPFPTNGSTWMHVAATFDGANMKLFINGTQEGSTIDGPASIATNSLSLGIGAQSDGGGKFQGAIDDARIYNRALSSAEIEALIPPPTITDTLVGHWAMEENTGAGVLDDASSYGNDATVEGILVKVNDGQVGSALDFAGTNNYAFVPDDASLDITGAITLAAWVKINSEGTQYILRKGIQGSVDGYELSLSSPTSGAGARKFFFRFNQATYGNDHRLNSDDDYQTGVWTHVAATYDGSTMRIYLNGIENSSRSETVAISSNSEPLGIGAQSNGTTEFNGTIDEARVYNYALSPAEIQAIANVSNVNMLAGHWKMDEGSGSSIVDATANNNDGSLSGSPGWVDGIHNQALNLDGSNDYAIVGDDASLDITNAITLAAWIKPGQQTTQRIIRKVDGTTGYSLFLSDPGKVAVRFNGNNTLGAGRLNSAADYPYDGSTWMHVAATYDGDKIRMYINGQENSITGTTVFTIVANSVDLSIGANTDGTNRFLGAIDDARVYNYALSPTEIQTLATVPNYLVAYWSLDAGSGSAIVDESTFGNDGSIIGTPIWVAGKYNQAIRLDGSSYIAIPDDASLDFSYAITMAAWIKPEANGYKQQILRKKNVNSGYDITLSYDGNNTVSFRLNGDNNYRLYSTSEYPTNGDWMHITGTYDGTTMILYINGIVENSTTNVPGSINANNDPLGIGADDDSEDKFTGTLDEVYLYNTALSLSEIDQLMNNPLPVELSSFTAQLQGSDIRLDWRTETEVNNYGFDILRRAQNDKWITIGFVDGYGNTNSPKEYKYIDKSPTGGTQFSYRLKQIDNDGSYEYSNIVEVEVTPTNFALYQNYPNPFNPTTTIKYSIPSVTLRQAQSDIMVTIKVYDVLGNEIVTLVNEEKSSGTYEIDFSANGGSSSLASGMYIYRMQAGSFVQIRKMMILK